MSDQPLAFSYRRVSSERQVEGDGIDRQIEAAVRWCEENGHTLSTATFEDLGVSAFKGRNAEVGALKAFLDAVETGAVPQRSTLLVESLDRLSRQHWEDGYLILRQIVRSGVNLVTLFDGKMFKAGEPIDFADGIMMLVGFQRAHEESATKSKRLKAAWSKNTEDVREGKRIRTSRTPGWLRVEGDLVGGEYVVVEEKAATVREVFTRFADGEGPSAIARDLQARGIPTMTRGNWRGPTVSQLLRSEAPYGHLEVGQNLTDGEASGEVPLGPGVYRKGARKIVEVIKDAMPRIVDAETERRVRFRLSNREAEVKPRAPVRNDTRKTKAMLTGVVKGDEGEGLKRKAYARTAAYVSPVTGRYYGAVSHIDQTLVDYWPTVYQANLTLVEVDMGNLEDLLADAKETLDFLQSRPNAKPRLLYAAQAEIEELEDQIKERAEAAGVGSVDLPRSIEVMEPHEVNQLVRSVIDRVTIHKSDKVEYEYIEVQAKSGKTYERRNPKPLYDLAVKMKNGLLVNLGEGSSMFGKVGEQEA